jgi:2-hydroxycyclohexanecarboxyl-CoA dehydrogenase
MEFGQEVAWNNVTTLAGKTVVVTGVASGIARATAIQFARAGARVLGGDINVAGGEATIKDIRAEGSQADFFPIDLSKGDSVDTFTRAVLEASDNKIDVIANVAGWEKVEPFLDNTPELWDRIIAINYLGPVRMIHRLLPSMIERREGKIITVASDAGRVGSLGETFYSGSKGAVIAFTKGLAREMARYNINCNVVCPGPTDTPLFATLGEKLRMALEKAIPFRRLGKPIEVAHSIVYLATPAAGFITGQVLSVSGGLTMHG